MSRRGWSLFVAMCVIWGIPYLLIKVGVSHLPPVDVVFGRIAVGALVLLPLALRRRELAPVLARWRPLVVFAMVEIAVPWLFLSEAETRISSSLSGLLVAAVPLAAVLIVRVWGSTENMTRQRLLGLAVGLLGVAAVVGLDVRHVTVVALLEMAVVVFCYALGPQVLSRHLSDLPSLGVVAAALSLCAVLYLPAALLVRPASAPPADALLAVLGLGLVCTALAFTIFFALIAEVGPVRSTVITYVNPVVAVLLGVLLLHEPFTLGIGVGFLLVLLGSVLATGRGTRRGPAAPDQAPLTAPPAEAVELGRNPGT